LSESVDDLIQQLVELRAQRDHYEDLITHTTTAVLQIADQTNTDLFEVDGTTVTVCRKRRTLCDDPQLLRSSLSDVGLADRVTSVVIKTTALNEAVEEGAIDVETLRAAGVRVIVGAPYLLVKKRTSYAPALG
jgi:predicted metal-dependent hydrolase